MLQIAYGNIIRVNHVFQTSADAKIQRFIFGHMKSEWDKIPSERSKIYEAFVPKSERSSESYELWNNSFDDAIENYGLHRHMTLDGVTHLIPCVKGDIFDLMWDASSDERLPPPRLMAHFEGGPELVWDTSMFFGSKKWVYGTGASSQHPPQSDF